MTTATPTPPSMTPAEKAYLHRMPKCRQCLTLMIPPKSGTGKDARVCVCEQKETVTLATYDDAGIGRPVTLTLAEARKVAEFLNKTCTRIYKRPSYSP